MKKLLFLFCFVIAFSAPNYYAFQTKLVAIHSAAADSGLAKSLLPMAENFGKRISDNLAISFDFQIRIFIAPHEDEFSRLTQGRIPEWGVAATIHNPLSIVLKSPRSDENTRRRIIPILRHEIAHFILNKATGGALIPRWFHEGFAVVTADEMTFGRRRKASRILATDKAIPLHRINQIFSFYPHDVETAYAECGSAMGYFLKITAHHGVADLARFVRNGSSFEEAFYFATGLTTEQFEEYWKESGKDPFAWGFFIWYLDEILWSVIPFLAILAFILRGIRNRRTLKHWEIEENQPTQREFDIFEA